MLIKDNEYHTLDK